jgi:tRNA U34 5-methylaminomethyl-2-thiouridine-forming methyltransferase MnmC
MLIFNNYIFNDYFLAQLVTTSDGSHTIYVPELDEHYHSIHGAVQESAIVFIRNGFDYCKSAPVSILEIGFGTGLNALLTAAASSRAGRKVVYTSLEKYPLPESVTGSLNHYLYAGKDGKILFDLIHSSAWGTLQKISEDFSLRKLICDVTADNLEGQFDLVYFDAFGPDKQPEMWTSSVFRKIFEVTACNGILVTYSAKGEVKRTLNACGFNITLLPGPPGKRQVIRAIRE